MKDEIMKKAVGCGSIADGSGLAAGGSCAADGGRAAGVNRATGVPVRKVIFNKKMAATILIALMIGVFCVVGCSAAQPAQVDINKDVPQGAPPLMPANHLGRYDRMGNASCLGCHGVNENGKARLSAAQTPPTSHFEGGDAKSDKFASGYTECNTCHVQS